MCIKFPLFHFFSPNSSMFFPATISPSPHYSIFQNIYPWISVNNTHSPEYLHCSFAAVIWFAGWTWAPPCREAYRRGPLKVHQLDLAVQMIIVWLHAVLRIRFVEKRLRLRPKIETFGLTFFFLLISDYYWSLKYWKYWLKLKEFLVASFYMYLR